MQRKFIAKGCQWGYTLPDMSEEAEDLNEFNSWDTLGAMLMLTMVPAVMNFVFNEKDVVGSVVIAGIGIVISVAVFGLALLTRWRIISRVVNLLGCVLTTLYIALSVYLWVWGGDDAETVSSEPPTVQQ